MSKIIRHAADAAIVYVGERHLDLERENRAERRLGELFPVVSVTTDPDGAKFISINEVFNIEKLHQEALTMARDEGYRAGFEAGKAEGLKKAEEVLSRFDEAIADAVNERQRLLEEARQHILDLVIQVSRKVTFDAVKVEPELTLQVISGVIATLIDRSHIKIKVNPDHLPIVEQNLGRFLTGSTTIKQLSVEPDPRVRIGGCMIETPSGDIDARLESQFEVMRETLAGETKS